MKGYIRQPNGRGFTLLELMVVLLIIGLMSALAVPRLTGSMSNLDLKAASQKILASLRYVRSNAASEKRTYVALFDFDNNRMLIARQSNSLPIRGALDGHDLKIRTAKRSEPQDHEQETTGDIRAYNLPDGISLSKGSSTEGDFDAGLFRIFFYPSGGSSGGDIIVTNARGRQYRIHVDFITGAVQLFEGTGQ